jgi:hypothetical protein
MTAATDFADNLWGDLMEGRRMETEQRFDARYKTVTCVTCKTTYQCTPRHDYYNATNDHDGQCEGCLLSAHFKRPVQTYTIVPVVAEDICPYCTFPVTKAQIAEGEAHPIDERGPDDQRYAHDKCRVEARYGA